MSGHQNLEEFIQNLEYTNSPKPQKLEYRFGYKPKLTRITPEQAQKYIPVEEDPYKSEAKYFTMEPDPDNPEWDIVTYYTNRSNRPLDIDPDFNLDDATWVYIMSNPSIPGQVKIGMTDRTIPERKKELDKGSGVPTPFVIEHGFPCINAGRLEREIHIYLESQGVRVSNDREFFYLSPEVAISVVDKIGAPYKIKTKSQENESDT